MSNTERTASKNHSIQFLFLSNIQTATRRAALRLCRRFFLLSQQHKLTINNSQSFACQSPSIAVRPSASHSMQSSTPTQLSTKSRENGSNCLRATKPFMQLSVFVFAANVCCLLPEIIEAAAMDSMLQFVLRLLKCIITILH